MSKLVTGVGEQGLDIELGRQQPGHAQQGSDVVHVAVYAGGHPRVLHLEHNFPTIRRHRPVHLADGGGGQRLHLKAVKQLLPIGSVSIEHHLAQLLGRHVPRVGAQASQDIGQFPRQEIPGVHGQYLPHLHGSTAHGSQLVRNPTRIGRVPHSAKLAMTSGP